MKALLLLLLATLTASACDTKGVGIPINMTVQPGATHTETFDYSDCNFGIRNNSYFVNYKAPKGVTVSLFDATTGANYGGAQVQGGTVFYLVNNGESMAGHVLQLTIGNGTRKSLSVTIQQSVCYCN